jgi:hypothetical protein
MNQQAGYDTSGPLLCDPAEMLRTLALFRNPESPYSEISAFDVELDDFQRDLAGGKLQHSAVGYFDDGEKMVQEVSRLLNMTKRSCMPRAIYILPNPANPALSARSRNKFKYQAPWRTKDEDITNRRHLLIDADISKKICPDGVSSSDAERQAANERIRQIDDFLVQHGWAPGARGPSGNGGHLIVRLADFPHTPAVTAVIEKFLKMLDQLFSDDVVHLDLSTGDAQQLTKLYGTICRKGDNTPDRPHRLSGPLEVPEGYHTHPIALEQMQALTAAYYKEPKPDPLYGGLFSGRQPPEKIDIERLLNNRGTKYRKLSWQKGFKFIVDPCLYMDHQVGPRNSSSAILEFPDGGHDYSCFHDHCQGKTWPDALDILDPGWRQRWKQNHNNGASATGTTGTARVEDIEPRPLPEAIPPVPAFDEQLLPVALRPWLRDIAERAQVPLEYPSIPAITALSSVIGRRITMRPKERDDWLVVPNLWGTLVGPPGVLKSPMMAEALKPLNILEKEARALYEQGMQAYEEKCELDEVEIKSLKNKAADSKATFDRKDLKQKLQALKRDKPPTEKRYTFNSPTIESAIEILAVNPNGVLLFRDELTGFLAMMERAGHEEDRAFYQQGWNGYGSLRLDRISRQAGIVKDACISIFGAITPGPLAAYLREAFSGQGDDGLIQRFQLGVYPDLCDWADVDRWPNTPAKNKACEIFKRLAALPGSEADADPPFLHFDQDAQKFFSKWRAELESKIRNPEEHPIMAAHLGKYRSLMPSIALILHVVDSDAGSFKPVGCLQAKTSAAWCTYLEAHARRIYYGVITPTRANARHLGQKLKTKKLSSPFTVRDVVQQDWAGLDKPEVVTRALELLETYGWVIAKDKPPGPFGGRPTVVYHINPRIKELP